MIKFDNVTATYSSSSGIFDLSFEISKGEIVFLMGPTGSGKSTVLRTIYKEINIDQAKEFLRKIPFARVKKF